MALFNQNQPLSQFVQTPDLLQSDTWLTRRNGKATGVKKALDWLLPVGGAVLGTLIAPGVGTKIGATLGTAANGALNRSELKNAENQHATDAVQNINNSLNSSVASGNLVNMASGLLNITPGTAGPANSTLQSIDPTADSSGALGAGAMNATGMSDYRTMLNGFQNKLAAGQQGTPWQIGFNQSALNNLNPGDVAASAAMIPAMNQSSPGSPRTHYAYQTFAGGGKPDKPAQKQSIREKLISQGYLPNPKSSYWNDEDSTLTNIMEVLDPSGVTSYDDVYREYKRTGVSPALGLEVAGALPILGKVGKGIKMLKGVHGVEKTAEFLAPLLKYLDRLDDASPFASQVSSATSSVLSKVPKANRYLVDPASRIANGVNTTTDIKGAIGYANGGKPDKPIKTIEEQQALADAGSAAVGSWVRARAASSMGGLTPGDAVLADKLDTPTVTTGEVAFAGVGPRTTGFYNPIYDVAYVRDSTKRPYTDSAHETTHQLQNAMDWRPQNADVLTNPFSKIIGAGLAKTGAVDSVWDRNETIINDAVQRSNRGTDAYLNNPNEVHSRLMEFRLKAGFRPNETITPSRLQQALDTKDPFLKMKYGELGRSLNDEQLIRLFNQTASTGMPADDGQFRAADGGRVDIDVQPIKPLAIKDNEARRYGRFTRMTENRIDDGFSMPAPVNPESIAAAASGTGYVGNWLNGKGYGGYGMSIPTPTILPERQFKARYGFLTAGANEVEGDGSTSSYLRDGMGADFIRTAAVEEATHAAQRGMADVPQMQQSLETIGSRIDPNADASDYYKDPREAQARLMRMREAVDQDPTKRFNRLGWMWKTLLHKPQAFKDLQQVMSRGDIFRSLNDTFAAGGKSRSIYPDHDKTSEDILMYDKATGQKVGEMRYKERIYDQRATDDIDKAVKSLRLSPSAEGFKWLGQYVFNETLTHKDHQPQYADGGSPSPITPTAAQRAELDKNRAWLRNWYQNRKIDDADFQGALDKDRADLLKPTPYPSLSSTPIEQNVYGASMGRTDAATNQAVVYDKTLSPAHVSYLTDLHEGTHQTMNRPLYSRTANQQVVNDQILPYDQSGFAGKISKEAYDKQMNNADEVSARLMVMRKLAGFQPDKAVAPDDLDGFMNYYQSEKTPTNQQVEDLLKMTGGDQKRLLNLLNFTTRNDTPATGQRFATGGKPEEPVKPSENIRKAQQQMRDAGLYTGPIDGRYTPATHQAVQHWNGTARMVPGRAPISWVDSADDYVHDIKFDDPWKNTANDKPAMDMGDIGSFTYEKVPRTRINGTSPISPPDLNTSSRLSSSLSIDKVRPFSSVLPSSMPPLPSDAPKDTRIAKTKEPGYNWLNGNNLLNAGRIVGGLVAANTPYPDEVDTSKYDQLVSEAESRREAGLSAVSRKLAFDALADNRSSAYEALRRSAGGGGTSGAVLAGIGQIGQNEIRGDLGLAQADEAQRERNRLEYRGLLGGQMDIANQRFNRQFGAVQATRQAGLNLIPQGVQGITDDYQYWKNYDNPNSLYQRYLGSQTRLADQQTQATKRIYSGTAQSFLAQSPFAATTPALLPAASPATPTAPTVMDYRQMFNPLPQFSSPVVPYRPR